MAVNGHRTQHLRFERELPGSVGDVHAVLTDPEFLRRYVGRTGSGGSRVVVAADRSRTCLRRVVPTRLGPPFVASFFGDAVEVVEVVTWAGTPADGTRTGQVCADASVAPGEARFRGAVRLTPEGVDTCRWLVDGHLCVKVPLIGGKLAPLVVAAIEAALVAEARLAEQVLRARLVPDALGNAAGL
ncbi:MAG: DUF2505 domain-containing protein [Actinomycetota bacterium]|jgi:uncharacterized protein YndB with AHSA1/START domain|nr:DUF2505 domain-containing protein [Actinomycetota bacterium]